MNVRLKTRPRPRFMRAAPTILVTGTWQAAFFDPIWASYFSLCKLCQPFWLFIKYSVNMAKLSETFSPLSHSIKCLPFVISLWLSCFCVQNVWKDSNQILSRQMKDDHVRERRLKLLSMCQALFERVTDSFPFIHSALFGERKLAWKIKRNKCFCHGTNDCGEFQGLFWFAISKWSVRY